ncbi:unnamed protein product [Mytilus edulis]|uniref:EF-hand domain-containing protein n=1 Tax=Mytilus edulis TaxID=6550 RepID=A0A8S3RFF0_MYTED|nr:unnamed protein product [Mytilus edulis]
MNKTKFLIGFIGLLLLFNICTAGWRVRIRLKIRVSKDKKRRSIESKGTEYSFDVPCNLINYDIDNNDVISIEEFAEALRQHEENTGVRELFVVIDKNDNYQYLEKSSAHPASVFKGFIIGEITRFIRSCCNRDDLDIQIKVFKQKLTLRGYSENEINPLIDKALRKNRLNTLCYKKRNKQNCPPLVLATKFNPLLKQLRRRIRKHWQLIENDITAKNLFPRPPMIAYRKHKNVKEYLTSAKL